jgi:hypothetical protein
MNSFIRIQGTKIMMLNLPSAGHLEKRVRSANQLDDDLWEITAFADDTAIAALNNSGYTVTVLKTPQQLQQEEDAMTEYLRRSQEPPLI